MRKYAEEGVCPKCGSNDLDYGAIEISGNSVYYPWTCEHCGCVGEEYYDLMFAGHNVDTESGKIFIDR